MIKGFSNGFRESFRTDSIVTLLQPGEATTTMGAFLLMANRRTNRLRRFPMPTMCMGERRRDRKEGQDMNDEEAEKEDLADCRQAYLKLANQKFLPLTLRGMHWQMFRAGWLAKQKDREKI